MRAALSIASRMTQGQANDLRLGPGIEAIMESNFPTTRPKPDPPKFAALLGKFMEPNQLEEALVTYRNNDAVVDDAMKEIYQESL
jgi:hypothetical protein